MSSKIKSEIKPFPGFLQWEKNKLADAGIEFVAGPTQGGN